MKRASEDAEFLYHKKISAITRRRMVTASGKNSFKLPQFLAVIFILLFISISLAGYLYYRSQKTIIIADKHRELLTLAALKKSEIATWRQARIEDGEAISENIYFPYRIQEWLKNESLSGHRGEILSWMANRRRPDYTDALLLDAQGTVRLSTAARSEPIDGQLQKSAVASLSARKPVLSDLFTSDSAGHIYINLVIPILAPDAGDSPAVGVLVFRIDPHKTLYPLIQTLPIRSATGETLLVRREGDRVRYLNELRHRKNTALTMELPLADQHVPAARAAQGQEVSFEGIDYRGMAVLAAVTAIPDSPWFLVAKIDEDEVLGPFRKEVWFITILVLALISVAGVSIMLFWRQQQSEAERRQYALEFERRSISQQYEYLKKYANDIILLFDEQGTILEANDRAIAVYGYSREELLHLHVSRLRAPASRSSLEADIRKIAEQGGLVFETLHQRKDETTFAVEISSRVVAVEGKTLYQSIIRDITDRKQAEQALRESQEQFRAVMEKANDAVFFVDTTCSIRFWNRTAEDIYGYRADEVLGKPYSMIVPKQFQEAHRQWLEKFLATDEETAPRATVEGLGERKDGSVFYVETSTGILRRGDDKFLIAIVRDITKRKKTEEEIKRKDNLLAGVAQATGPLLSQGDLKSAVTKALATIGHNVGVDRVYVFKNHGDPQTGEHLMSQLYEWAHENVTAQIDNPELQNLSYTQFSGWHETMAHGAPVKGLTRDFPAPIRAILDPENILSILLVPIIIADTFWGFIGFDDCKKERAWSDSEISILLTLAGSIGSAIQRHQAEQELISTRDFLENIFNTTSDGIMVSNARGYLVSVNTALEKMLGFSRDELIGKHTAELGPQDNHHYEIGMRMLTDLREKGFINNVEAEWLRKDGTLCPVELNISRLQDRAGTNLEAVSVVRDISERKKTAQEKARLEAQLYQSQKMEAVGHLAGGIAHDFNNILTAIMGYGSLLQAKLKETDSLRNHVDQILTSAERAAALVRSLLAYSRKQIINPQPVKINAIVINVENMLHRIIGEDINLQTVLSDKDTTVVADAGQIEQLLINLATNARDAMPMGGHLTIITGRAEMDEQFIKAHGYGTQGIYVLLTVSDTGSGMDEKTRQQIFEPFFTTKEVGKGTGLGLSTVYGIVKQHNGFTNCYSETGTGTTFKIYLPLVKIPSGPAVQPSAIARPPVLQGGSETILLAEDDDDLRKLIRQVLEDFGYTVLAAADGDEAVGLFREHHDTINLLLLDVIMPKKNGREAYAEMQKIRPAIKALFTSGYTADIIHKQGLLEKGLEFILKPVSPTELLKKVRDVLDK